jgi:hypothetical protein
MGSGQTTSLFRRINDEIRALGAFERGLELHFVCECGDAECLEPVPLTEKAYDAARRRGQTLRSPNCRFSAAA